MAGKVKEVLAKRDNPSRLGDPLLPLDDSLLSARKRSLPKPRWILPTPPSKPLQIALESAQLQYDLTLSNALRAGRIFPHTVGKTRSQLNSTNPSGTSRKRNGSALRKPKWTRSRRPSKLLWKTWMISVSRAGSANFLQIEATLVQARLAFQNAQEYSTAPMAHRTARICATPRKSYLMKPR